MMIRKEKAAFLDNILKQFAGDKIIKLKEPDDNNDQDIYNYMQIGKHLKMLEKDGMIQRNEKGEYRLKAKGFEVLKDIENLGYLGTHKKDEEEYERLEMEDGCEEEKDVEWEEVLHGKAKKAWNLYRIVESVLQVWLIIC